MNLSGESLVVILLVGLVAGWLAGKIVTGWGFGLVGDIAIGIVGALVGSWLFPRLGIHIGTGIVNQIIAATVGLHPSLEDEHAAVPADGKKRAIVGIQLCAVRRGAYVWASSQGSNPRRN